MTVKELIKALSEFDEDMGVVVEHQKQSMGTLDISFIFEAEPDILESNDFGYWKENVVLIRVR